MSENRALVIHFHDTTKLSFIFPRQSDDHSVAEKVRQLLGGAQLVIEADDFLYVIPQTSIKYVQAYPAPDKLPDNVIQGATLRAD